LTPTEAGTPNLTPPKGGTPNWDVKVESSKEQTVTFRRLWPFIKPYTGALVNAVICLLALSILGMLGPLPGKILIDEVLIGRKLPLLWVVIGAIVLLALVRQVFSYLNSYTIRYVGSRLVFDLRTKLFRHLQDLSLSFYDQKQTGKIMSRLMGDVSSFQQLVTGNALSLITNIFQFFAVLAIMLYLHWKLTLVAMATFPGHLLTYYYFRDRVRELSRRSRDKWAAFSGSAHEVIRGTKLVKSFAAERREAKDFVHELKNLFNLGIDMGLQSQHWGIGSSMVELVGRVLFVAYAAYCVIRGELTVGTYFMFQSYLGMLHAPVMSFVELISQIVPALTGMERVFEILDMRPEVQEAPDAVSMRKMRGDVEFRDVSFQYADGEPVLHHLSFRAKPGEVVALVGPSGAGKSTVANLISRFYDVTSGQILVDGVDMRKVKLRSLREQIGSVLQETILFSGTIEENVLYGNPEKDHDDVESAAREANAHDFIASFPDGYRSEMGENGVKLSGGQRQRIAIARAILKDPRILILDEATSSLDTVSEALIQQALERLMKGRTTFIIAHRLSTIRNADKIVVLQRGRIEQIGKHAELLAQDGLYRKLYSPQLPTRDAAHRPERAQQVA